MKKTNKYLGPRHKRLSRQARLQVGKKFIEQYQGKKLIAGYRKWFAVSSLCAAIELKMLGQDISDQLIEQYRNEEAKKAECRTMKKAKTMEEERPFESDYYFSYIAGYTSNGVPYGITWEEWDKIEDPEGESYRRLIGQATKVKLDEMPF
ncbi:MAG: hypothetical protein Q7J85_10525 [Bacillota bacterium]|nr:hypothetical protein [Bacillota bacterium]